MDKYIGIDEKTKPEPRFFYGKDAVNPKEQGDATAYVLWLEYKLLNDCYADLEADYSLLCDERSKLSEAVYILTEALSQYAIQGRFHHYESGLEDIDDYGKVAILALKETHKLLDGVTPYEQTPTQD